MHALQLVSLVLLQLQTTVEPLNKGHLKTSHLVISKVKKLTLLVGRLSVSQKFPYWTFHYYN